MTTLPSQRLTFATLAFLLASTLGLPLVSALPEVPTLPDHPLEDPAVQQAIADAKEGPQPLASGTGDIVAEIVHGTRDVLGGAASYVDDAAAYVDSLANAAEAIVQNLFAQVHDLTGSGPGAVVDGAQEILAIGFEFFDYAREEATTCLLHPEECGA